MCIRVLAVDSCVTRHVNTRQWTAVSLVMSTPDCCAHIFCFLITRYFLWLVDRRPKQFGVSSVMILKKNDGIK
jgi:hypothetical protein